jgi:glycosyltransferase involved in cell wall biosynthesis
MAPKISIVMPVYNREWYVGTAIESVLNQTISDFELLIWDDGSTDRSFDIARRYAELDPRVRAIAAPHRGIAPSVKAAFASTTGTYIGSVDSDDLLAPDALQETAAILDAHPEVGMVYTNHRIIDEHGQDVKLGCRCDIPYSRDRMLVDFMTFHFRLLRRDVYEQVGGIDESFELSEDYDLCLRLSEATSVYHLQKSLYYYRKHSENITNQQRKTALWGYKACLRALKRRGLDQFYRLDLDENDRFILWRKKTIAS